MSDFKKFQMALVKRWRRQITRNNTYTTPSDWSNIPLKLAKIGILCAINSLFTPWSIDCTVNPEIYHRTKIDAYFAMGLLLFSLMIELFRCIHDMQLESSDKKHRWAAFPVGRMGSICFFGGYTHI